MKLATKHIIAFIIIFISHNPIQWDSTVQEEKEIKSEEEIITSSGSLVQLWILLPKVILSPKHL